MDPITQIIIAVVLAVIAFIIMPKPAPPKPDDVKQLEVPTTKARMVPVFTGQILFSEIQVLWAGDKSIEEYKIKVDKK